MKLLIVVDVSDHVDPTRFDPVDIAHAVLCDDAEWLGEVTDEVNAEFTMAAAVWASTTSRLEVTTGDTSAEVAAAIERSTVA